MWEMWSGRVVRGGDVLKAKLSLEVLGTNVTAVGSLPAIK